MAQGFEVDWDVLDAAGRRILSLADDVHGQAASGLLDATSYGHRELIATGTEVARALAGQQFGLELALEELGEGLRASARSYSDADALAAVAQSQLYVR